MLNLYVQYRKEDCCGCTACITICPAKCIAMVSDEEGFLYPKIDKEKSVNLKTNSDKIEFDEIEF